MSGTDIQINVTDKVCFVEWGLNYLVYKLWLSSSATSLVPTKLHTAARIFIYNLNLLNILDVKKKMSF